MMATLGEFFAVLSRWTGVAVPTLAFMYLSLLSLVSLCWLAYEA